MRFNVQGKERKKKRKEKKLKVNLSGVVQSLDEGALKLGNELLQLGLDLVEQQSVEKGKGKEFLKPGEKREKDKENGLTSGC